MADESVCELLCIDAEKGESLRRDQPPWEELVLLAEAARGLGDPTRLALAGALCEGGELCVCDLAWISARSDKLVSHHLRLMRAAGLLDSRKDGRMVLYSLTPRGRGLLSALRSLDAVTAP